MRRKENVKCAFFGEYKWHVMVHCKHSRLAKSAERPISGWQRGHSLDVFFSPRFGGASFQRASQSRGRGRTAGKPCNRGFGSSCPLFLSIHKLVYFFPSLSDSVCSRATLQPVHPERVLCGGVCQHHVWVVEHVQAVQGQRVDLQLVQRKLRVWIEADVADARQWVGQLFGEARRRLACDWNMWHRRERSETLAVWGGGGLSSRSKAHSDAWPSLRGGSQTIVTEQRYETR